MGREVSAALRNRRASAPVSITDEIFESIVAKWDPEVAEMVRIQRRDLARAGVREPLRTEMACAFAEVLLGMRKNARGESR